MESIIYQATLAPKSDSQEDSVHGMGKDGIPVLTPVEDDPMAQAHIMEQISKQGDLLPDVVMVKPEQVLAAKRHAIVLRRIVRDVQKSPAPPATFQPVLMSAADQLDKLAHALAEISSVMEREKEREVVTTFITPEQVLARPVAGLVVAQVEKDDSASAALSAELALANQRALRFEQALNSICEVLDKAADRPIEAWTISSAAEVANEMGDLATRALEELKASNLSASTDSSDLVIDQS